MNVSFEMKQVALDQAWWNLDKAARTKLDQPSRSAPVVGSLVDVAAGRQWKFHKDDRRLDSLAGLLINV
jgi:hypothetical protein